MSTDYRPLGRRRITYAKLSRAPFVLRWHSRMPNDPGTIIRDAKHWRSACAATHDPSQQAHITLEANGDFLHLQVTQAGNVIGWTRYGGNDPGAFLEWLEDSGIDWADEHDDDYYP